MKIFNLYCLKCTFRCKEISLRCKKQVFVETKAIFGKNFLSLWVFLKSNSSLIINP